MKKNKLLPPGAHQARQVTEPLAPDMPMLTPGNNLGHTLTKPPASLINKKKRRG